MNKKSQRNDLATEMLFDVGIVIMFIVSYGLGMIGGLVQAAWIILHLLQQYPQVLELLK